MMCYPAASVFHVSIAAPSSVAVLALTEHARVSIQLAPMLKILATALAKPTSALRNGTMYLIIVFSSTIC